MAVPTWEEFMVPVLQILSDGTELPLHQLRRQVADHLGLSDELRDLRLPSGDYLVDDRINWTCSYLFRVGAVERPQRGHYKITDKGEQILGEHPTGVTERDLRRFASPDDKWWLRKKSSDSGPEDVKLEEVAE